MQGASAIGESGRERRGLRRGFVAVGSPSTLSTWLALILASWLVAGCSDPEVVAEPGWSDPSPMSVDGPDGMREPLVRDSAGARWVSNVDPLWGDSSGWWVDPVPLLTLGATYGEEPYLFSSVDDVLKLNDRVIVVADEMTRELRAFSTEGRHLWTAGGAGEGPGEFAVAAFYLERMGDGSLRASTTLNQVRFTPEGRLIEDRRVDWAGLRELGEFSTCGGFQTLGGAVLGDKYLFVQDCSYLGPYSPGLHRVGGTVVTLPRSLARIDTIGTLDFYEQWVTERSPGDLVINPLPLLWVLPTWNRLIHVGGDPARLAHARVERYRIALYDLHEARLALLVERPDARRPLTPEERREGEEDFDRWVSQTADSYQRSGRSRGAYLSEIAPAGELIPDSITDMDRILFDEGTHLWVGRRTAPDAEGEIRHAWDVFRHDGVWLGEVEFPDDLEVYEIGEDYVLGVTTDEWGVPTIEMYGLHRGGG